MARLSIGVERLGAEGFRLELGGLRGATNVVALAPGGGIRGRYEQDNAEIGLRSLRADTLALSEFAWALPNGTIELAAPSQLRDVEIDASIGRGDASQKFVGSIRARTVEASVTLELGATKLHAVSLVIQDFSLRVDPQGVLALRFGTLSAGSIRTLMGAMEFVADGVATASPCTIDAAGLHVEDLDIGRLHAKARSFGRTASSEPKPAPTEKPALDLSALRCVFGTLALDVIPDVTLPIIGSRKATHAFNIPIEAGVVSLAQLESGLSTLEGLFIDFEVRPGKLVLERDIPLVPLDNKPLVEWDLDEEGQALGATKRVAIETLARPRLPTSTKEAAEEDRKKKGKAVELRRLDIANIDIALRCAGGASVPLLGGSVQLGDGDTAAIAELEVTGGLAYAPGDPLPGAITATAKSVHFGLHHLGLGGRSLSAEAIRIDGLERAELTFAGLRPSGLEAVARGIHVRGAHLIRVETTAPST